MHVHDKCEHGPLDEHRPENDAVCFENVSYTYPGAAAGKTGEPRPALQDVTLHVERGCALGIVGPNGAGKTTLMRIVLGEIRGYRGQVLVEGLSPRAACRKGDVIGYVPQRHETCWRFPVSVRQVVRMGLVGRSGPIRRHRREDLDHAEAMLERVGVADLARRPIGDLSGGQQQRVMIARALAARPKVLLLDEPTVGVDEAGRERFARLLRDLHRELSVTLVIISHDLQAIAAGCNRVAVLHQTLHYHDAPEGLTAETLREVFEHDVLLTPAGR
ncbi:MAG: metal ABC transporter ATP-binding protein [Phycisphaeraceae bacterium]